jgi:hypothetical protein
MQPRVPFEPKLNAVRLQAKLCPTHRLQVLAENAALAEFKKQVVGRRKVQDAEFAAKQKEALEVRPAGHCHCYGSSR